MASQQQVSNTPLSLRDRLRTPDYLFKWANERFMFDVDLAADVESRKCSVYIGEESDSLYMPWAKCYQSGWCNPPYSSPKKWLKKAWEEAQQGFNSVFLIPTPNGEDLYRDHVFGKASEVIMINGRISFIAPEDFTVKGKKGKDGKPDTPDKHFKKGDEMTGNTRGSCLVVYSRRYEGQTLMSWVNRDDMKGSK
jgi:phage N-6-adenine-methyltransferase